MEIPPGSAKLDRHYAALGLRYVLKGDYKAARDMAIRAPHWKMGTAITVRALQDGFVKVLTHSSMALLQERANEMEGADSKVDRRH
eukprot:3958069-Amphidinium_carterae.1